MRVVDFLKQDMIHEKLNNVDYQKLYQLSLLTNPGISLFLLVQILMF